MKKLSIILVFIFCVLVLNTKAQLTLKDSLDGFDTKHAWEHTDKLTTLEEKNSFYEEIKRNWLKRKYSLGAKPFENGNPALANKPIGGNNSTMQGPQPANCTNIDFESGNTSTWLTSGLTQVVSGAGLDPNCGFPLVYPGGNSSLKISGDWTVPGLNQSGGSPCFCTASTAGGNFCTSQASRVITVAPGNTQLQLHYAMVVYNYPHSATDCAFIEVSILNASGTQLACPYFKVSYYSNTFFGVAGVTASTSPTPIAGCTGTYNTTFLPWQTVNADLSPYVGQNVTLIVKVKWCQYQCDWAYAYIDADCLNSTYNLNPVCPGTQACAPAGFATYTWSIPGGGTSSGQCITPTNNGIYTVTAAPSITCSPLQTMTLSVVGGFTPSVNSSNVSCNLGTNGSASVTCIGSGPFTYTYLPTGGNAANASGLAAGNYSVLITDGSCTITKTFTITQPPVLTITAAQTASVICLNGNNGIATATASGGTLGYTYSWLPAGGTTSVASNLVAGTYTVQLTDANNCVKTATAQIIQPPLAFLTLANNSVSCIYGNNGTASVVTIPVANTSPYTYTWTTNPIQNTAQASNLTAGTYSCILQDNAGCVFTGTTTVIQPASSVSVSIATNTNQVCMGNPINFTAIGVGGMGAPYTYSWSTGAVVAATTISEPIGGTYTYSVLALDVNSCTATAVQTVTFIPNPVLFSASKDMCYGLSVNLAVNGANSYSWSPSTGLNVTTGAAVVANPAVTTIYTILGNNSFCTGVTTVTVGVVPYPNALFTSPNQEICYGNSTTINATGAMAYNWMPNYNISSTTGNAVTVSPLVNTTYTITSYNFSGTVICSETKQVPILVVPQVTPSISSNKVICAGEKTTLVAGGGNTFVWTPSVSINHTNISGVVASPTVSTIYTVQISNTEFCGNSATVSVIVNPNPTVFAGRDTTFNLDEPMFIHATGTGTLTWVAGEGIFCYVCPSTKINATHSGCYGIETVNEFGCKAKDEVCIEITTDFGVYIPNIFTPNEDGLNEVFLVFGYSISEVTMDIFDRWGEKLFSSTDQKLGWNGTYKGALCKNDVYVYKVSYKGLNGKKIFKTGHVTLNR